MADAALSIAALEPLAGRGAAGRRVRVSFESGEVLDLPVELVAGLGWRPGDRIASREMERARRRGEALEAREHALRLLDHQARTRRELEHRLRQAGHGEGAVRFALAWCSARGFLDDRRFAESWVASRKLRPEHGSFRIRQELAQRGVDASLAREVVEAALPSEEELDRAVAAAHRRLAGRNVTRGPGGRLEQAEAARLGRYLAGRGFPYEIVRGALQRLGAEAFVEEDPDPSP
ncbi:regulatory protein RecX [Limnochorda pilosa]|uniref:Regulatory protein RecX n=1 Tax=Limnochorda pilosa TaxID=1555112 RepID=A0A0K2SKM2_LIMPI|nr:regulatory protein RecX [Limnochorda pilosa]BAS27648.1 RecX family transcriptional regulator [Limnochorda pilosa]